jgi:PadR family transcriptional regulator, regulatory protein PadR
VLLMSTREPTLNTGQEACATDVYKRAPTQARRPALLMSTKEPKTDVLQGTLDLMVLRTLETMGPQHGFGLAKRIQQISGGLLDLNQGTLYPALLRMEQRGWIQSRWGTSDSNRRAKFYELTRAGRKQVTHESQDWARMVALMERFLRPAE